MVGPDIEGRTRFKGQIQEKSEGTYRYPEHTYSKTYRYLQVHILTHLKEEHNSVT